MWGAVSLTALGSAKGNPTDHELTDREQTDSEQGERPMSEQGDYAAETQSESAPEFVKDWVSWGAGIRASQNLILAGKVRALLLGRYNVSFSDVRALAPSVFRHRILLNFHAEAERITTDEVIRRLLEAVPEPSSDI